MSLDVKHFHKYIVMPTLNKLEINSYGVNNLGFAQLIIGTALTESNLQYLRQFNDGPAKGVFQMEDATHDDIWNNFLKYKPEFAKKITAFLLPDQNKTQQIYGNLYYATAMCAAHYIRFGQQNQSANNLPMLASIWKKFYNTPKGKGTEEEFISKAKAVLKL